MKTIVREERIKREGSPYFTYTLPSISAGEYHSLVVGDDIPQSRKYLPLDFIEVTNNDSVSIEFQINEGDTFLVPAGVIKTVTERPIRRIRVKNKDTTTATIEGKIVLLLQAMPITTDKFVRRFKL